MFYDQLAVGDTAAVEKTISEEDVYLFADIIGDLNPVHVDQSYAETTRFATRIVHGILTASLFSTVFGMHLPGPGSIYVSQTLNFVAPVPVGEAVRASVTVAEKLEKGRVRFDCVATRSDGTVVVTGEAILLPPRPAA